MNSIDSKIPRRTECGDHIHDCPQLAEMLDDLREENARLKARLAEMYERIIPEEIAKGLERLTREREDARAEVAACDGHAYLRDEIKRLEGLILDWESSDVVSRIDSESALWAEARRIREAGGVSE